MGQDPLSLVVGVPYARFLLKQERFTTCRELLGGYGAQETPRSRHWQPERWTPQHLARQFSHWWEGHTKLLNDG
jgi:hypothetical protein